MGSSLTRVQMLNGQREISESEYRIILSNAKYLYSGKSFCPSCKKFIPGECVIKDKFLVILKHCLEENLFFETITEKVDMDIFRSPTMTDKKGYLKLRRGKKVQIVNQHLFDNVLLFITSRCNTDCNACFRKIDTQRKNLNYELTMEEINRILNKYKNQRRRIVLYGGEPTVHPNLVQIIRAVRNSGNIVTLYTNGFKLVDENYLTQLINSELDHLFLSMDGFSKKIYGVIRGNENEYEKKLRVLQNLRKYNVPTRLQITVAKGVNDWQIEKIIKFAIKNSFIKEIYFIPLFLPGTRREVFSSKNLISRKEILNLICNATDIRLKDFELFWQLKKEVHRILGRLLNLNSPLENNFSFYFKRKDSKIIPLFKGLSLRFLLLLLKLVPPIPIAFTKKHLREERFLKKFLKISVYKFRFGEEIILGWTQNDIVEPEFQGL